MLDTRFWYRYFTVYDLLNLLEPYQKLLGAFAEELGDVKGMRILDAGAGTGNLSVLLQNKGAEVVGLDFSKEGLEIFKTKLPTAKVVLHDLTKPLPFSDGSLDAVVSNNTIYALPTETRPAVFKEFFRVIKPGGKIVVSNVREGWKPFAIYRAHIMWSIHGKGVLKTLFDIVRLIAPTIKIFYYNSLIRRENRNQNYSFVMPEEQRDLLSNAGFSDISDNKPVYADQGIFNFAKK